MPKLDETLLLSLIDQIYEAGADTNRWNAVLDRLGEIYDAKAVLFTQDLRRGDTGITQFRGFDAAWVNAYRDHYGIRSPWLEPLSRLPAGTVVTDVTLTETDRLRRTEFYADWLRPQRILPSIGAVLEKTGTIGTNVALNRYASRGPITEAELQFFTRLAPHLRRALVIYREAAATAMLRDGAIEALGRAGFAMLVADAEARIVFATPAGERILRAMSGLCVAGGRLAGRTAAATAFLREAIRRACAPHGATGSTLHLPRPASDRRIEVSIMPLRAPEDLSRFAFRSCVAQLLVGADETMTRSVVPEDLLGRYGLTRAEARLFAALLDGAGPKAYAAATGLSLNTVRTQLKQLFAKTGQNRQADLVRLALSDPMIRMRAPARSE